VTPPERERCANALGMVNRLAARALARRQLTTTEANDLLDITAKLLTFLLTTSAEDECEE
jgi:hypothetical protein